MVPRSLSGSFPHGPSIKHATSETSLKDTKYRFRLSQNTICEHCDEEEPETTEHYLLKCTNWDRAREQHLGRNPTLTLLQTNPINIILFATSTGHFKSPDYQEGS